ncbi:hypothetical protein ES703_125119 [subsurface metagenome]
MSQTEMVKCPFCGTHKPIRRTGVMRLQHDKTADKQYNFVFDHVDLGNSAFISIRECQGRGKGFPEVSRVSLKETIENDSYKELRQSLLNQCYQVMTILVGEEK